MTTTPTGKPVIAASSPIEVDLVEGQSYYFCTCGLSAKQPYCDGAHKKSDLGLKSHAFTADKTGKAWLCMCKHTGNRPFCDGTHNNISE